MKREISAAKARAIGKKIGVDFNRIDIEQFRMGLGVELEHGSRDIQTNVTDDDLYMTGKIAWAHLKELPNYYSRLHTMEYEVVKEPGDEKN